MLLMINRLEFVIEHHGRRSEHFAKNIWQLFRQLSGADKKYMVYNKQNAVFSLFGATLFIPKLTL